MDTVGFGIIGAGRVAARSVAPAIAATPGAYLAAVASRDLGRARAFAAESGADAVDGYAELLKRDDIGAVYVSLPAALNEEWAARALAAGKDVLCEKPAALSSAWARKLASLAADRRLLLAEGYMFVHHPREEIIRQLVAGGIIGEPVHFEAKFGFPLPSRGDWRLDSGLGGGAVNDHAGYVILAARRFLAAESIILSHSVVHDRELAIDVRGMAALRDSMGRTAQVAWGFGMGYRNETLFWGREGFLRAVPAFSVNAGTEGAIAILRSDGHSQTRSVPAADHFRLMVGRFVSERRDACAQTQAAQGIVDLATVMEPIRAAARILESAAKNSLSP